MTIASECILARELGLQYAALCMVDNLANGLGDGELSVAEMEADRVVNAARPARRPRRRPAAPRAAVGRVSLTPLTVTGARSTARRSGCAAPTGLIEAIGPEVAARPGEETIDAGGAPLVRAAGQRPHPRGDDPVPRLRRRPAADAVAGGADLAGRGEARRRGRLLGRAARLRGDDPQPARPASGTCTGSRGRRRGRSPTPASGRRSGRRCSTPTATPRSCGAGRCESLERAGAGGGREPADLPRPRPARDLHGQRGLAALDRRARRRARAAGPDPPLRDRAARSKSASPPTARGPPPTSTGSGC